MKNSVLALFCVAALTACKKNESTVTDTSTDSVDMVYPMDSAMTDTTMVSGTTQMNEQDRTFANDAAKGGMMEVMVGNLAAGKATNAKVKSLAEMMVRDHSKANDELKSWATGAAFTLPSAVDDNQKKEHDDLQARSGAEFDRAYADMMVRHHTETIEKFKQQASGGSDSSLKAFAEKTLPTLEHHLMEAQATRDAVK
ncbi:DUF4142 domain-containing protein [Marnyiella aurantia]|uniref:DUF4142 domain-containing protein n=1 Tax=Marnyiella aurantia TaxID=2758037 RepID=A0A7D7LUE4_9FLAO|nr:DUF4142 domain-containing protein [Marnyiella aurantia]MBA5245679.1 DUF4142 domain-containing protein [Marnyiella aurantia]QMS98913.1 DUF4142 domain-containing protein [Marnyiella aurantia]